MIQNEDRFFAGNVKKRLAMRESGQTMKPEGDQDKISFQKSIVQNIVGFELSASIAPDHGKPKAVKDAGKSMISPVTNDATDTRVQSNDRIVVGGHPADRQTDSNGADVEIRENTVATTLRSRPA